MVRNLMKEGLARRETPRDTSPGRHDRAVVDPARIPVSHGTRVAGPRARWWMRTISHGKALLRHCRTRMLGRPVAKADNRRWSLYGAPWLQPVAIGGKSTERRKR